MRRSLAFLAVTVLVACGAADGLPGAPPDLERLSRHLPPEASDRGMFLGMGSALHLDGSLGFGAAEVQTVLESGAPPFTVLSGSFDGDAIAAAAARWGYEETTVDGRTLLSRPDDLPADAPALVRAVPALAVLGSVVLLGTREEVARGAGRDFEQPGWIAGATRSLGPDVVQAVVAPVVRLDRHAQRLGADTEALLARHGARTALGAYEGFAIGRATDDTGVVALVYGREEGGHDQAAALATRLATTSVLGQPGRRLADAFEPGGPRWVEAAGVVRLPLVWTDFDADRLRGDVEEDLLVPLVPGQR